MIPLSLLSIIPMKLCYLKIGDKAIHKKRKKVSQVIATMETVRMRYDSLGFCLFWVLLARYELSIRQNLCFSPILVFSRILSNARDSTVFLHVQSCDWEVSVPLQRVGMRHIFDVLTEPSLICQLSSFWSCFLHPRTLPITSFSNCTSMSFLWKDTLSCKMTFPLLRKHSGNPLLKGLSPVGKVNVPSHPQLTIMIHHPLMSPNQHWSIHRVSSDFVLAS